MQNEKSSADLPLIIKILIMGGMVLFLLIPLVAIQVLIKERGDTRQQAEAEIVQSWGGVQTVTGPMISVPYVINGETEYLVFMPDTIKITGRVEPSTLNRGIYKVAVYNADLALSGEFSRPLFEGLALWPDSIRWDLAKLVISLENPLSLREPIRADIAGTMTSTFETEKEHRGPFSYTLSAPIDLARFPAQNQAIPFSLALKLKGGQSLTFIPVAENTSVTLSSSWTDPSFFGPPLPTERNITEEGFSANWDLVGYRFIPERIKADELSGTFNSRERSAHATGETIQSDGRFFGVELMIPVDTYVKADRSAKYGILFLLVPFIGLLLFELFANARIHLVQYFLIGVANVIFYLLLISLSEHIGFDPAYLVAALVTTFLTAFYAAAFLKSALRTIALGVILAVFYGFLYILLLSQDYALLVGSLGVFGVLALLMVLTRKVDWYALRAANRNNGTAPIVRTEEGKG